MLFDMKPIEERADIAFMQGLRCVEYRIPKAERLREPGYLLALALRYGLIGVAATHHLLLSADPDEESDVLALMRCWPRMVEDHVRWDVLHRLPYEELRAAPALIGRLAYKPLGTYLPLYRKLFPLEQALRVACDEYCQGHRSSIGEGWLWFLRPLGAKKFRQLCEESRDFALHFFERREAGLDELPEIALIGE
jgi:hypothetical protein